eukprot:GCRY01005271.1.p1 GENE.GCRY01005271.1~~GCRY01005271.1.p1  ORF type:complete len:263 (-),score=48.68 GCRY01005271.1:245-1033(-)
MNVPEEKYKKEDKVFVFHEAAVYEGKILKVNNTVPETYVIHYQGFKNTHDEKDVGLERILKPGEETKRIRRKFEVIIKGEKGDPLRSRKKKKKILDESFAKRGIRLYFPEVLKNILLADDQNIRRGKLNTVPANIPISKIFKDYVAEVRQLHEQSSKKGVFLASDLTHGLSVYFNQTILTLLTYKMESEQTLFLQNKYPDLDWDEVYGFIHLLRLIVKMPELVAWADLHADCCKVLQCELNAFVLWLSENHRFYLPEPDESF